jgi:hydroxymethylbilane synthase
VAEVIAPGICLPAVGQGALAVEIRDGDAAVAELVSRLDRPHERAAVTAERAFLRRLEGGCQVPLGALGEVAGGNLRLRGVIASLDGSAVLRDETAGPVEAAEEIGVRLAEKLLGRGAAAILEQVRLASNAE